MAVSLRSASLFSVRALQRVIDLALTAAIVALVILFGLQFPHSAKLDALWPIVRLRHFGDPVVAELGSWFDLAWPSSSRSFFPLGVAFATWMVKVAVDAILQRSYRWVGKLIPAGPVAAAAETGLRSVGLAGLDLDAGAADSEQARAQLLKRYREIESSLKEAKRKHCAFLSVDIVGSTQMKQGEGQTQIAATFQAYEEMLKKIFDQHGAWKQAWTPDGVMVCFLQPELAVGAAQRTLQSLKRFNEKDNKLKTPFRIRCGLNEGEVAIFEDSKLEKVADRVIDVAGHLQKQGDEDALWISAGVYNLLTDKVGFQDTGVEVDGHKAYEWTVEGRPPRPARAPVAVGGMTQVGHPSAFPLPGAAKTAGKANQIGRYEILQELGRGAMGAVYKARDPKIGRTVAIKVILTANLSPDDLQQFKERFHREAQTAGQMSHPGIVTIHDVADDEIGQPYLVMEFIEGTPLEKILAEGGQGAAAPRRSLSESLDIAAQIAEALDYAHRRGVIHRDIKPANILITHEGRAKIADFGIAKVAGTSMTQAGLLVGTPAFMAPEQFLGGKVDGRSDIFSLGVMLYLMCTNQKPFTGDAITEIAFKVVHGAPPPPRQLNAELPPELERILLRCLAKKPDDRYQTGRELATDLAALKVGQPLGSAALRPATPAGS